MSDVKEYFRTNKKENEVHQTSDGFLFKRKQDADAHAPTLDDKTVTKHTRGKTKVDESDDKSGEGGEGGEGGTGGEGGSKKTNPVK